MAATDDWITSRITQARAAQHLVTNTVVSRMESLLRDQLTRRQLTTTELKAAANQLITSMIPPSPEAGAKQ